MVIFALKSTDMKLSEWIRHREITGKPCFSFSDVAKVFTEQTEQILLNSLSRYVKKKRLALVSRRFYCIIPPQYALTGIVPPSYYVNQLMTYLGKPYYVSLLSAATFWGAAHQRPQQFSVMTTYPRYSRSSARNNLLLWFYRTEIPETFLLHKNTETSSVKYSNAELTALDLIQFEQHIGGLSRASTVLSELLDYTDFNGAHKELFKFTTIATVQRLGYIVDNIIEDKEQADVIFNELIQFNDNFRYCWLSTRHAKSKTAADSKWKVYINAQIEPDEL